MPAEARLWSKGLAAVRADGRGRFFLKNEILDLRRSRLHRSGRRVERVRRTAVGIRFSRGCSLTYAKIQRKTKTAKEKDDKGHTADIEQNRRY